VRLALGCLFLLLPLRAGAQAAPSPRDAPASTAITGPIGVPPAAQASDHFDPEAAARAYLAIIPTEVRRRADAYYQGLCWLSFWDFALGAVIGVGLLASRLSSGMRTIAERLTRFAAVQTFLYWTEYTLLTAILTFPLSVYEDYFREHYYGLATQTFGPWLGDQLKSLLVSIVLGGLFATALVWVVRRVPNTWWIWGSAVSMVFIVFTILISPVYLVPIFNKVTLLHDPTVTDPVLRMARANGIPARDVFEIDASRQSTRMSANVSGFGSTMRITLNDNLLRRGSPEEIEAVMGHEMGHYVLHHVYNTIIFAVLVITIAFAFLRWSLGWCLGRWGQAWGIRGVGDTAVIPLAAILMSTFFFVGLPFLNTFIRTQEYEADIFGLNASRQPDGFAQAAIHLGEYRRMEPGPIEEWIFFDHPSGYSRIYSAMRWKAENLRLLATSGSGGLPGEARGSAPH
jgi:STE24 endopeptidase